MSDTGEELIEGTYKPTAGTGLSEYSVTVEQLRAYAEAHRS